MTTLGSDFASEVWLDASFELDRIALAELGPEIGASEEHLQAAAAGSRLILERYAARKIILDDGGDGRQLWLKIRLHLAPGSRLSAAGLELQWPADRVWVEQLFPQEIHQETTLQVVSEPGRGFYLTTEPEESTSPAPWTVRYLPTIRSSEAGFANPWWSFEESEKERGLATEILLFLVLRVSGELPAPQLRFAAELHAQNLPLSIPIHIERELPTPLPTPSRPAVSDAQTAIDLQWEIRRDFERGEHFLVHRLTSPSGKLGLQSLSARSQRMLERDWNDWSRRLFGRLEAVMKREKHGEPLLLKELIPELRALGNNLWSTMVPAKIQQALLELEDQCESLLLVTDDTWIPWEIAVPEEKHQLPFLSCRFHLARWFDQTVAPPSELPLTRLLALAALRVRNFDSLAGDDHEPLWPDRWPRQIPGLSVSLREQAEYADTVERLAGGAWDWLHFDGHGDYSADDPETSSLVLVDRRLEAADITERILEKVRQNRPLIFLNACRTGRVGQALFGLGGWPHRWVRQGECGALLCTQWPVVNRSAGRFAEDFYSRLRSGTPLGRAVFEARRKLLLAHPNDPTPLAYVLYGHPNAVTSFGEDSAQKR